MQDMFFKNVKIILPSMLTKIMENGYTLIILQEVIVGVWILATYYVSRGEFNHRLPMLVILFWDFLIFHQIFLSPKENY